MICARRVAVVGAGLVGMGWAIVFARAGLQVRMFDVTDAAAERGRRTAAVRLDDLAAAGLLDEPADAVLARIVVAGSLEEAVEGAGYVQESAFERLDVKRSLFAALDAIVDERTVIGSSSSGIPASAYTDHVACRGRCLVVHPVNPPYLVSVVELVPAPWTEADAVETARQLMRDAGQQPVTLHHEIDGFILNRLQGVLLMEAWKLYEDGVASLADIDRTVSEGLGPRWAFMGPFETIDLNAPGGIADYAARLGPLYVGIANARRGYTPWPAALVARAEAERREVLPADRLEERAAWRDRRLMALARWKQSQEG